ncbi:MAG TPA: hypothetical protein VGY77_10215, partial [Gemmataceae bacterium]|nr:hypothetical protein [Gemmataceae bacterium]
MLRSRLRLEVLEERDLLSTLSVFQRQANPLASFFAVGGADVPGIQQSFDGSGDRFQLGAYGGRVQVRRLSDGSLITDFAPFGPNYHGRVSVAVGDVNHDGIDDLIVGKADPMADAIFQVKIFNGVAFQNGTFQVGSPDLSLIGQFSPYEARFHVGVNVAVGDIENNGFADIITAPTAGNPDVRVFRGQDIVNHIFNPVAQWFAYGLNFNVGANLAAGDINGNGFADIVTGATCGNAHVKVYDGRDLAFPFPMSTGHFNPNGSSLLASFFAYDLGHDIGAFVSVGATNSEGFGNVITGQTRGGSLVKVFDGRAIAQRIFNRDNNLLDQFFAFDTRNEGTDLNIGGNHIFQNP